ncbi:MAG: ribulose-phosphate 3-epimerase [Chloroflexota bacterium]|jgi:ribulose-phosphate 3-epimerase|nr:ribulose-phosphate 3-epimerase [Chloroflexota bacterium]
MLDADQGRLAEELADLEAAGADRVQWDIMDGSFVPRITHGADQVAAVRGGSGLPFEAHLMVDRPEAQWQAFAEAGCDVVIVHAEATRHLHLLLQDIRAAGKAAGVALNPATPFETIAAALDLADLVLVMTVNPGRGGQAFIPTMTDKVAEARAEIRRRGLAVDVEVDGGISVKTAAAVAGAGANLLVAGSAVHRHPDGRRAAIAEIRAAAAAAFEETATG